MKEVDTYFLSVGKVELLSLRKWLKEQTPMTEAEDEYLSVLADALNSIHYEFKIPMIEP